MQTRIATLRLSPHKLMAAAYQHSPGPPPKYSFRHPPPWHEHSGPALLARTWHAIVATTKRPRHTIVFRPRGATKRRSRGHHNDKFIIFWGVSVFAHTRHRDRRIQTKACIYIYVISSKIVSKIDNKVTSNVQWSEYSSHRLVGVLPWYHLCRLVVGGSIGERADILKAVAVYFASDDKYK